MFYKKGIEDVKRIILKNESTPPLIRITETALLKMQSYVDLSSTEIAWLCYVKTEEPHKIYTLYDCDLVKQSVSSVTAELDEKYLSEFAMKLIENEEYEKYNTFRGWGHSHVNMQVNPSGTDNETYIQLYENCEFFIRIICNKNNDIRIDFVDVELGYEYDNIDFEWIPEEGGQTYLIETNKLKEEISKLEKDLEFLEEKWNDLYNKHYEVIKKEQEDIVKEVTKPKTNYGSWKGYNNYYDYSGYSDYYDYDNYSYENNNDKKKEKKETKEEDNRSRFQLTLDENVQSDIISVLDIEDEEYINKFEMTSEALKNYIKSFVNIKNIDRMSDEGWEELYYMLSY